MGKPWSEVTKITAACAVEIPVPVKVSIYLLLLQVCGRMHPPLHSDSHDDMAADCRQIECLTVAMVG